jgi:hypothetical protein
MWRLFQFTVVAVLAGAIGLAAGFRLHDSQGPSVAADRVLSGNNVAHYLDDRLGLSSFSSQEGAICPEHIPAIKGRIIHCQVAYEGHQVGAEVKVASKLGLLRLVGLYGWTGPGCWEYLPCYGRP